VESVGQGADPAAVPFQAASKALACSQTQLASCFYPCSLPLTAANVTLHTISSQKPGQEFPLTRNKHCSVTLQSPRREDGWAMPQTHGRGPRPWARARGSTPCHAHACGWTARSRLWGRGRL